MLFFIGKLWIYVKGSFFQVIYVSSPQFSRNAVVFLCRSNVLLLIDLIQADSISPSTRLPVRLPGAAAFLLRLSRSAHH